MGRMVGSKRCVGKNCPKTSKIKIYFTLQEVIVERGHSVSICF
jgi:hypothetical protein